MKKTVSFTLSLVLLAVLALFASAETMKSRVYDNADLLTYDEEVLLRSTLDSYSAHYNFDIAVVTSDSLDGKTASRYADDFYDTHGFSDDGILFLVSMEERDWAISTSGLGITFFSDYDIDYIAEEAVPYLSDGDYYEAFDKFASLSYELIKYAKEDGYGYDPDGDYYGDGYSDGYYSSSPHPFYGEEYEEKSPLSVKILISLAFGLIAALITLSAMKSQMKQIRYNNSASSYIKKDSLNLTRSHEMFLYRNVSKIRRQTDSSSGSSSSHRGGGSFRSSSSGRSHGGRSGKF